MSHHPEIADSLLQATGRNLALRLLAPVASLLMLLPVLASAKEDDTVYQVADKDGNPVLEIMFRQTYKIVWDDHDTGADLDGAAWVIDPKSIPEGFKQLGHVMTPKTNPTGKVQSMIVKDISAEKDAIATPAGVSPVWDDAGSGGSHDLEVFALKAPRGYRAIGAVVRSDGGNGWGVGALQAGNLTAKELAGYACLREDLVDIGKVLERIWSDEGSGANKDFSSWTMEYVDPLKEDGAFRLNSGSFVPNSNHGKPEDTRAFVLKFFMPKDPVQMRKWFARASKG